jgi:3',5'-cyclic AMP phosphodiesterase CpdA
MRKLRTPLLVTLLICLTAGVSLSSAQSVTFVQFTDAHLFDSAKHRALQAGYEDYLDNRASFAWAVKTANGLALKSRCVDFIVFTGDFGLEDADPVNSATEVATFLRALTTKQIFLVPGNNDLKNEDPRDLLRFRAFADEVTRLLAPDHQVVDLARTSETINGIHLIGMDSATFKNDGGKLTASNAAHQLSEMRRVEAEVKLDGPSIIFTHIPNLEDPHRGDDNKAHEAWNVAPDIGKLWQKIVNNDQLLAVFAGHFHDPRQEVYRQNYSWTTKKPSLVEGKKTWVAPPLAVKFQLGEKSQARGLFLATVTKGGNVAVSPKWYTISASDEAPDKGATLLQAQTEADYDNWKGALSFYREALASSNPAVRAKAELGYVRARRGVDDDLWFWRVVKGLVVLAALITALVSWHFLNDTAESNKTRGVIVIETPLKLTNDAPVEYFAAALVCAAKQIESIYRAEETRTSTPLAEEGSSYSLSLLSGADKALKDITSALPDIHGVKVGKLLDSLPFFHRFFLKWRIECGLGTPDANQAFAYSTLRWRWSTTAAWTESAVVAGAAESQEPSQSVLLKSLAWKLASDILSKDITNNVY